MPQIKTENVSDSVTGHIPLSSKGKTGKKTVIEDVEDDIDEPLTCYVLIWGYVSNDNLLLPVDDPNLNPTNLLQLQSL